MVIEKSSRAKTLTLSLRLDPKTRFMLEFMAKLNRQSITTVVEEAIRKAGSETRVNAPDSDTKTWRDYWDVSEGIRAINMLADFDLPSSFEDDEVRNFILWHIEFFSDTNDIQNPDRTNVDVLWPNLENYLQISRDTKRSDPWAAGQKMADDLQSANLRSPNWPRADKSPPKAIKQKSSFARDLDDEVPF